jgi:hypothetical protein
MVGVKEWSVKIDRKNIFLVISRHAVFKVPMRGSQVHSPRDAFTFLVIRRHAAFKVPVGSDSVFSDRSGLARGHNIFKRVMAKPTSLTAQKIFDVGN